MTSGYRPKSRPSLIEYANCLQRELGRELTMVEAYLIAEQYKIEFNLGTHAVANNYTPPKAL